METMAIESTKDCVNNISDKHRHVFVMEWSFSWLLWPINKKKSIMYSSVTDIRNFNQI